MAEDLDKLPLAILGGVQVPGRLIVGASITNAQLAPITRGSVKVGGAANAPTDLVAKADAQILIGNGMDLISVAVTGDVTIDDTGATTIGSHIVGNGKIAVATQGCIKATVGGTQFTDMNVKDTGKIVIGNGTDPVLCAISGDATLVSGGALTLGAGVVTGAKSSATMATKSHGTAVPTVGATGTTEATIIMPVAGTITGIRFTCKDSLAQHASNYLTFAVVDHTNSDAAVLAATDANTTKTSTGTAITGYATRNLALSGTGANLIVAAGDVLKLQFASNSTLANTLTEGYLQIDVLVTA